MKHSFFTRTVIATALMTSVTAVTPISAQAEWSANVAMTSDYRFRGMSQNDETIAIQGGFDYAHDSGFYVGTWASSIDWQDGAAGSDDTAIEVDLYAGYGGETSGGIGYDAGVLRYVYPNAASGTDYDTTEIYGSLSYSYFTASLAYSNELNFLGADESTYFNLAGDYEFDNGVGIGASWGTFNIDEKRGQADLDYDDWKIYVSKSFGGFDFELAYIDTDEDGACKNSTGPFQCDSTAVFTVSKSM